MKRALAFLTFLSIWAGDATRASAAESEREIVVIVNPANTMNAIDRKFLAQIFLKKKTRGPNGESVFPADLSASSEIREWFSERFLERGVSAVKNYWQRNIFSGYKVPPPEFDREEDVTNYVRDHPGAIGYVSEPSKAGGTKVLSVDE